MRIGIHQPNYLPWIGYFHKIHLCDTFVFFDNVQISPGKSFVTRNRVNTNAGVLWLTVPTQRGSDGQSIAETMVVAGPWAKKHLRTIELAYSGSPWLKDVTGLLRECYRDGAESVADLNIRILVALSRYLELGCKTFVRASEMGLQSTGSASATEIIQRLGADEYVTGQGAGTSRTIDEATLAEAGVKTVWLPSQYPAYPQRHQTSDVPLSIIDVLLNCGPDGVHEMVTVG